MGPGYIKALVGPSKRLYEFGGSCWGGNGSSMIGAQRSRTDALASEFGGVFLGSSWFL